MNNFERRARDFHRKPVSPKAFDVETTKDEGPLSVQERGHMGGLIGGPKRDEVLTSAEKEKIARQGGHARWGEGKSERE